MTDFLVLPVQEAVAWLRAWTDHSWPMTLQEAFTIRDHLGWKPAPDDGRFFTTKLATDGQEDGVIGDVDEGGVDGVNFPLSSRALPPQWAQAAPLTRAAYPRYVQALTTLWGPGQDKGERDGVKEHRWVLPNQVSVTLVGTDMSISANVHSPHETQAYELEIYYKEKGYE